MGFLTRCQRSSKASRISTAVARAFAPQLSGLVPAFARCALAIAVVSAYARGAPAIPKHPHSFFSYVVAMRGCTQEDAPALEIYLTRAPFDGSGEPPEPYIRVEISSSPTETITRGTFKLSPLRRDPDAAGRVARAQLVERGHDPIWLTGTIVLSNVAPGQRVSGRLKGKTSSGKNLLGDFTAEYSKRTSVCG